jgi:hypothetical protein
MVNDDFLEAYAEKFGLICDLYERTFHEGELPEDILFTSKEARAFAVKVFDIMEVSDSEPSPPVLDLTGDFDQCTEHEECSLIRGREDLCHYGKRAADDPRSLECDYSGMYPGHPDCGAFGLDSRLAACISVGELRAAMEALSHTGESDGMGGSEYHHALAHLRYKLEVKDSE